MLPAGLARLGGGRTQLSIWEIAEAARLLRPGGQLIFLVNSALLMLDGISSAPRLDVRTVSGRS